MDQKQYLEKSLKTNRRMRCGAATRFLGNQVTQPVIVKCQRLTGTAFKMGSFGLRNVGEGGIGDMITYSRKADVVETKFCKFALDETLLHLHFSSSTRACRRHISRQVL